MKTKSLNPIKLLAMLGLAFGLVMFTGCGDPEPEPEPDPTENIMELVRATAGLDSLEKYLDVYPNLVAALGGAGDMTFFAPNNAAFISLLATPGFPSDISFINPKIIEGVLAYHISTSRYDAPLTPATVISSIQGETIVVNADGTLLTGSTNDAIAIESSVKATNGVMHITGSVLIPPSVGQSLTPILGTNAGTLLLSAAFSTLSYGIMSADTFAATNQLTTLVSILANPNAVHTVFAPTNATFEAGSITGPTFTGQQWYGIILNHIVMQETSLEDYTHLATFPTAFVNPADGENGSLMFFEGTPMNGIGVFIDGNGDQTPDAEIALVDQLLNSNGRVQVIAGLLAPAQ